MTWEKVLEQSVRSIFLLVFAYLASWWVPQDNRQQGFYLLVFLTEEKVLTVLRICSALFLLSEEFVPGRFICLGADYCLRSSHC